MAKLHRYKKKATAYVVAVKVDLDTKGFTYHKWGGLQTCKSGDWLVYNQGDTYTIDQETFSVTYEPISPGLYVKSSIVWAEVAEDSGAIVTKEGETHYRSGDYLVYNNEGRKDGYAIDSETFKTLYELIG
jgi:hypothetical protein